MEIVVVPRYGNAEMVKRYKSYNRDVIKIKTNSGDYIIVKSLRENEEGVLSLEEILTRVKRYISKLAECGVPIIPNVEYLIEDGLLWEFYPAYKHDLSILISEAKAIECHSLYSEGILKNIVHPLFTSFPDLSMDVGLDIAPRNFVTNNGRVIFYSDYVPAKARIDGLFPLEYPEPQDKKVINIGVFRHYDKRGLLLVLITQSCKLRPEYRSLFLDTLHKFLLKWEMKELSDFLKESPAQRLKKGEEGLRQNEEIIESLTGLGPDYLYLRDVACEIAYWAEQMGRGKKDRLAKLFNLTHLADMPLSSHVIEGVKREIIRWNFNLFSGEKEVPEHEK